VSKHTIYAWKQKCGGLEVAEAQELKQLRDENVRLKRLVAEYLPDFMDMRVSRIKCDGTFDAYVAAKFMWRPACNPAGMNGTTAREAT
jgi:hypothetical protein